MDARFFWGLFFVIVSSSIYIASMVVASHKVKRGSADNWKYIYPMYVSMLLYIIALVYFIFTM